MKKTLVLAFLLLSLTSCAFLKDQKANWEACKADQSCYESAKKWKDTGEVVGGLAGSAIPGAAMPAQKVTGYLFLAVAMLLGGHAINKKKTVNG